LIVALFGNISALNISLHRPRQKTKHSSPNRT
jgi:hypothetical protein